MPRSETAHRQGQANGQLPIAVLSDTYCSAPGSGCWHVIAAAAEPPLSVLLANAAAARRSPVLGAVPPPTRGRPLYSSSAVTRQRTNQPTHQSTSQPASQSTTLPAPCRHHLQQRRPFFYEVAVSINHAGPAVDNHKRSPSVCALPNPESERRDAKRFKVLLLRKSVLRVQLPGIA